MTTNIKDEGDHYVLNGAKLWISNSPECQVAVVWAKNEQGRIGRRASWSAAWKASLPPKSTTSGACAPASPASWCSTT
ncbi:MAG: acyl-CoA dehydrogenase family protein [Hymenobacter sp.]